MKKAKITFDTTQASSETSFVVSHGWLSNFMRRHGLSLRRHTSIAQKDPEQLNGKLASYVIHVRRLQMKFNFETSQIYAMDETPAWQDMVGTTTVTKKGSQDVVFKSTGHKKTRVCVLDGLSRWSEDEAIYRLQWCEMPSQPVKRRVLRKMFRRII